LYHNSPFSSRGVAICIKNTLNIRITGTRSDRNGNILALTTDSILTGTGTTCILAIYGPNDNNREFYADLDRIITESNCDLNILGGDWNSTWDINPANNNIDTFMMQNIPSRDRSERVKIIAEKFRLCEPFRHLYPNRKEFSYVPNAVNNLNRSRIDFFLISNGLTNILLDSEIGTGKLSTAFDHKPIFLKLGKKKVPVDPNKICNNILSEPIIGLVIELTVKEAYLNNADPDAVPGHLITGLKQELGRIFSRLKTASEIELNNLRIEIPDPVAIMEAQTLINESFDIAETVPSLEFFESIPLAVEPDNFFEGLILAVKNEILSKQSAIYKTKNFRKKILRERITELKKNFTNNRDEIFRQEAILNNIIENDLKLELEKYHKFERLNQEKLTPYFMNLVRGADKNNLGLDSIHDNDGNDFVTDELRQEYIGTFYANLYKKETHTGTNLAENCIEEFLGQSATDPAVISSKLSEQEKQDLDQDLTIEEFDEAVKQIKKNTSPGIDGISNKFIKKFWKFFRRPLFNYTTFCLEKGTLTDSFRSAKIRLIPKKGDPKKISNWRPISLLNCFYKLVSRVLTNRIRTVSDKITKIGQMGYSSKKCCQEVPITLIDTIYELKRKGKQGCILSLDIKKAFDTLSHDFMLKALKFFNFGDKMISWIQTICTNRKACIILSNNKLGFSFDLERGNAQGDIISPFIFNICYQLLLLKIECDLQINHIDIPAPAIQAEEITGAAVPVSHRSRKVFAFADDCNVITCLEKNCIDALLKIIEEFGIISGLKCNVQKSHLLPVGHNPVVPDNIANCGFGIAENITVLGFAISNNDDMLNVNWNKIIGKVLEQRRIWSRFNLSLPGRITVAKSMFYSQINYMGSILPVPDDTCNQIEDVIHNFVSGNLRIAKNRSFLPVANGGLGLFRVADFLDAQKCSWVRRSRILDQEWKIKLILSGHGNLFTISDSNIDRETNPILHTLAKAFRKFISSFTVTNNNFKAAHILHNQALTIGIRSKECIGTNEMAEFRENNALRNIVNLKMDSLIQNDILVTKINFQRGVGFEISRQLWEKLDKLRRAAITRSGNDLHKKTEPVETFFNRWKKGSKPVRKIIDGSSKKMVPHNIVKFADNMDIIAGIELSQHLNKIWNRSYLSNELRTFIFKLHNNTLPLNTVLSHFVRNHSRNCTFCDLARNQEEEDESALHFFYQCNVSENIRDNFFKWLTRNDDFIITRQQLFGEFRDHNNYYNDILNISSCIFLKYIWDCKLRKHLPDFNHLKNYYSLEIQTIKNVSSRFLSSFNGCGLNLDELLTGHIRF
jgi:exonuclease III